MPTCIFYDLKRHWASKIALKQLKSWCPESLLHSYALVIRQRTSGHCIIKTLLGIDLTSFPTLAPGWQSDLYIADWLLQLVQIPAHHSLQHTLSCSIVIESDQHCAHKTSGSASNNNGFIMCMYPPDWCSGGLSLPLLMHIGLIKHNDQQVPISLGCREAMIVKCLAQIHKYHCHSQNSKPHSDDSHHYTNPMH